MIVISKISLHFREDCGIFCEGEWEHAQSVGFIVGFLTLVNCWVIGLIGLIDIIGLVGQIFLVSFINLIGLGFAGRNEPIGLGVLNGSSTWADCWIIGLVLSGIGGISG